MSNKVSIKKRIKKGEVVVGPFCIVPSGTMIDTLGYSGMDFCILDTEHGPLDMQTITDLILVAKGTGVDPIVRVGENNERLIDMYKKIINSFENSRTEEFIKLYFGNSAINTTELNYILPIYL